MNMLLFLKAYLLIWECFQTIVTGLNAEDEIATGLSLAPTDCIAQCNGMSSCQSVQITFSTVDGSTTCTTFNKRVDASGITSINTLYDYYCNKGKVKFLLDNPIIYLKHYQVLVLRTGTLT